MTESVASPLSFTGSAERIWRIPKSSSPPFSIGLAILVAIPLVVLAWAFVLCWYLCLGATVVPYRLIRRGQRRRKIEERRHNELREALAGREPWLGPRGQA